MSAFEKWFKKNFENHVEDGAAYLMQMIVNGPQDNVAWDYLKETGDESYTPGTFLKASQLILKKEDNK